MVNQYIEQQASSAQKLVFCADLKNGAMCAMRTTWRDWILKALQKSDTALWNCWKGQLGLR